MAASDINERINPLSGVFQELQNGSSESIIAYIEEHTDSIHDQDSDGNFPLHWACWSGKAKVVKCLLEKGTQIDVLNSHKQTPSMVAALRGHTYLVWYLLEHDANLHARDAYGFTILHHAAQKNAGFVCYLLVEHYRMNINLTDGEGHTPLSWASYQGHKSLQKYFIRKGANVNLVDKTQRSPLHWAVIKGKIAASNILALNGAYLDGKDEEGETPLEAAQAKKYRKIEKNLKYVAKHAVNGIAYGSTIVQPLVRFWATWSFCCIFFGVLSFVVLPIYFFVPLASLFIWYTSRKFHLNSLTKSVVGWWGVCVFASGFACSLILLVKLINTPDVLTSWEHSALYFLIVAYLYLFITCIRSDPGALPKNTKSLEDVFEDWKLGKNTGISYCISCKIVKPLRSKHCEKTNKCIARFDHYCHWISNSVGFDNHRRFLVMCIFMTVSHIWFLLLTIRYLLTFSNTNTWYALWWHVIHYYNADRLAFIMVIFHSFFGLWLVMLTWFHIQFVGMNLTTNEKMNFRRYKHFKRDGMFHNYFNKGIPSNFNEFFFQTVNYKRVFRVSQQA